MLHLINSIPRSAKQWQVITTMLVADDSILFYDEAANLVMDEKQVPILLEWGHQGVDLFALADELPVADSCMPKPLVEWVTWVDWDSAVDLVAQANGVQSL